MEQLRIAFMGTPEFAVPVLRALIDGGKRVVGVFTQPDRPKGRSGKPQPGPVKQLALERGIPVYQFEKIRRAEGVAALTELQPDLVVTAAFGQILTNKLLNIPRLGTVNVHASLLPKHRGAAPINWSIMLGETVTGVTTMFTDRGLDTGDMIESREIDIGALETAGELTDRLSELGAELLMHTLTMIESGECPRVPQNPDESTYDPMLDKEHGLIDWSRSAREIACQVRGVNPWPGAYTPFGGGVLKLWLAEACEYPEDDSLPGTVIAADKKQGLIVRCGEGYLNVLELQMPGAKRLKARDYLNGKPIQVGTSLYADIKAE